MRSKEKLHEALMLFTVEAYLSNALREGITKEPTHHRITSAINGYRTLRRFDDEEFKLMQRLGQEKYMEKLKQEEVSHVVYAMQLLKRTVEAHDVKLPIGRKHLIRGGRGPFVVAMLMKKKDDPEKYAELKEIIDTSVLTANKFFDYTYRRIVEEEMKDE